MTGAVFSLTAEIEPCSWALATAAAADIAAIRITFPNFIPQSPFFRVLN
jgi:hypothetical protein